MAFQENQYSNSHFWRFSFTFVSVNIVKNIFFIFLASFTFASTVGMGVFTHFCEKDGKEQSFLIPQNHHCEAEKESISACCQHEEKTIESDCCSDQVDYYQFDFESFENHSLFCFDFLSFPEFINFSYISTKQTTSLLVSNFANPPPKRWGRQLLIHHQVFRI